MMTRSYYMSKPATSSKRPATKTLLKLGLEVLTTEELFKFVERYCDVLRIHPEREYDIMVEGARAITLCNNIRVSDAIYRFFDAPPHMYHDYELAFLARFKEHLTLNVRKHGWDITFGNGHTFTLH